MSDEHARLRRFDLGNLPALSDEEALELAEALPKDADDKFEQTESVAQEHSSTMARRGLDLIQFAATHIASPGLSTPGVRESTANEAGALADRTGPDGNLPGRIGRFEIVRELGRGGFGLVLLAFDPILARPVALKIPRPEALISASARIRFEREARAAAILSHPGIVPLFETELEGPIQYAAFGYVAGETLADFMRRHSASLPPGLAANIVAKLAEAVEHAHQRGVIHRDLKPGNVLLDQFDDGLPDPPQPLLESLKITDFGLAKFSASESQMLTKQGAVVGTPSYMAPEQALGRDAEIGPATDVYSLGAILYELLTGRPPFKGASDLETLRAVELAPPRPPRQLNSHVPRDLEAICLKCLEKSPKHRYAGAGQLAADLHRFDQGLPVQARPTTRWRRAVRWCARNPALTGSLAAVLLCLSVGLTVALVQQRLLRRQLTEITQQKSRADAETTRARESAEAAQAAQIESERQRKIAQTQADIATFVRQFLFDDLLNQAEFGFQLTSIERAKALGLGDYRFVPNPTINELVRRVIPKLSAEQLQSRFPDDPVAQAEVLATVARLLKNQSLISEARPLAERAVALYKQAAGESDPGLLESQYLLAVVLGAAGEADASRGLHQAVIEQYRKLDTDSPQILRGKFAIAALLQESEPESALALLREIMDSELRKFPVEHPRVRRAVNVIAHHHLTRDQFATARGIILEHYPQIENELPTSDREALNSVEYLAAAELNLGRAAHAVQLLQASLLSRSESFGDDELGTLMAKILLANALTMDGQAESAIALLQVVLPEVEKQLGIDSPPYITCANNLGHALWFIGRAREAIPVQEAAYHRAVTLFGGEQTVTLQLAVNLACSYRDSGRHAEAIDLFRTVVPHIERQPELHSAAVELIWAWQRAGELDQAERYCRTWLSQIRGNPKATPYSKLQRLMELGRVLFAQGNLAEARALLQEARDLIDSGQAPGAHESWLNQEAAVLLGVCLMEEQQVEQAGALMKSGCHRLEELVARVPQPFHENFADCYEHLTRYFEATGDQELAAQWRVKAELLRAAAPNQD